jgi:hypothetical protein
LGSADVCAWPICTKKYNKKINIDPDLKKLNIIKNSTVAI